MADTLVVVDALIVVPELNDFVVSAGDEVLALGEDRQRVQLTGVGSIEHADGLAVVAVPVGDLAVGASSDELRLVRVVDDLLEHCRLKQAHDAVSLHDVPDDARSVERGRNSLLVVGGNADVGDAPTVLLEGGSHDLCLHTDLPDAHLALHAARDNT